MWPTLRDPRLLGQGLTYPVPLLNSFLTEPVCLLFNYDLTSSITGWDMGLTYGFPFPSAFFHSLSGSCTQRMVLAWPSLPRLVLPLTGVFYHTLLGVLSSRPLVRVYPSTLKPVYYNGTRTAGLLLKYTVSLGSTDHKTSLFCVSETSESLKWPRTTALATSVVSGRDLETIPSMEL